MADVILPDDVRDFILGHIDSVAELEALLLLRNHAEQNWTIAAAAKHLYVSEALAAEALARLAADGLCICSDEFYRYHPSSGDRSALIDRLCEAYAQYLIPVTDLVRNKPARIQKFVDAFGWNSTAKKSNVTNSVVGAIAVAIYAVGASAAFSAEVTMGNSTISLQRAIAIALNARPGVITAEALEGRDDVTGLRYSFYIKEGSQSYEVDVDAVAGRVLEIVPDTQHPH